METIAIFDLDKTITRVPTYTPFLAHCLAAEGRSKAAAALATLPALAAYGLGLRSRGALKERMLAVTIAGRPRAVVEGYAAAFVQGWLATHIRPGARAAIARHRAAGDRLILATASFGFYARLFARGLGIGEVIATAVAWDGDHLQARLAGDNCYGAAKLAAVQAHLEGRGPGRRVVYSDHHSDFELMRWAGAGVAVNPDAKSRRLAAAHRFAIADWEEV